MAQNSGINVGDELQTVDDWRVSAITMDQVFARLRSPQRPMVLVFKRTIKGDDERSSSSSPSGGNGRTTMGSIVAIDSPSPTSSSRSDSPVSALSAMLPLSAAALAQATSVEFEQDFEKDFENKQQFLRTPLRVANQLKTNDFDVEGDEENRPMLSITSESLVTKPLPGTESKQRSKSAAAASRTFWSSRDFSSNPLITRKRGVLGVVVTTIILFILKVLLNNPINTADQAVWATEKEQVDRSVELNYEQRQQAGEVDLDLATMEKQAEDFVKREENGDGEVVFLQPDDDASSSARNSSVDATR